MKTTTPTNSKPKSSSRKPKVLALAVVVFAALVAGAWAWVYMKSTANHAEEVVKPFEGALVAKGGIKRCVTGDPGHGPDNDRPWYQAYYELPTKRDNAIELIGKIAMDNGYKLTHASPSNKGSLLGIVDDKFIDNWFFDNTSKASPYADLEEGKVDLRFAVNNDGAYSLSHLLCETKDAVTVNNDAEHSAVRVDVQLPRTKR